MEIKLELDTDALALIVIAAIIYGPRSVPRKTV